MGYGFTRRGFVAATAPLAVFGGGAATARLDRTALVRRHNPVLTAVNPRAPLSVGNGEFAFTADVTGLQSIAPAYEKGTPLCTQPQWGWHSYQIPDGLSADQLKLEMFDTYGRQVGYKTSARG
jgi:hypothetical protein